MDDTQKMLRAIINNQSAVKQEILAEIRKNREGIEKVEKQVEKTEENLTKRVDKLGLDLAELSDDAPTIKEFDSLEKRVTKLEDTFTSL